MISIFPEYLFLLMYKSSKSLNLKGYPKITERSIYTMKTINTERESYI